MSTVVSQEIGEAGNEKIRKCIQGGFVEVFADYCFT